jgi:dehydrogenase/reductase SDR family protein 7B
MNTPLRVLITGSSRGIGRETALRFARGGAHVVINGRDPERLQETRLMMVSAGHRVDAVAGDIGVAADAQRVVSEAVDLTGGLDVLVNNAGIAMRGRFDMVEPDVWQRVIRTNVLGTAFVTRAALPYLVHSRGTVVFVSSLVAKWGFPLVSVYSASKMALDGLAESLRSEMRSTGIHVVTVYVGISKNDSDKHILAADGSSVDLSERAGAMSQDRVATAICRAARRGRAQRVLTFGGHALSFLVRVAPWSIRLVLSLSGRRISALAK